MAFVSPPDDFAAHSLTEFAELQLLLSGDEFLSSTELRNSFTAGRQPTEEENSFMHAEVENRARRAGRHYPFSVFEGGLHIDREAASDLYFFLLLMSLRNAPARDGDGLDRSDPLFDAIAREAFRESLGDGASSLIFAWPPRDGRPSVFSDAVAWAATRIGVELRGGVIEDHPRDAGVDVIAWRDFPDGRTGFPILLAQNTVQFQFVKKPRDVQPSRWRDWLRIGVAPGIGFAVPFAIPDGDIWWDDVCTDVTLVLDRVRLIYAVRDLDPPNWPEWDRIREFVTREISEIIEGQPSESSQPTIVRPRRTTRFSAVQSEGSEAAGQLTRE